MKPELNILMLEDNASDAELVQNELRQGGFLFRAECVQTQKAFVDAIEQNTPDVILSDHGLPAFNGFAAMAVAKKRCPDVPFIFVIGLSGGENEIETFERGDIDYVLKSQLSQLVPVVWRAVHEARERADQRIKETAPLEGGDPFRALVEGVKDYAICMLDELGRVTSWNAGAQWLEGYHAKEIIGQHFSQFYPVEAIAAGRPAQALAQAITQGRFEEETLLVRKDRFPYWAHICLTALRNARQELLGFAFVARDITAHKQTEVGWESVMNDLKGALTDVKTLTRLLPACASCKKVRDHQGQWHALETFVRPLPEVALPREFCPECSGQI